MGTKAFMTLLVVALCVVVLAAAGEKQPQKQTSPRSTGATVKNEEALGEKKFQTHCGRCHNEPQQLPPAIAGTVLRHMRVRAMLSREDEQLILRYLAP
jgi:hypothetical protein